MPRDRRPKTRAEAKRLIRETFDSNTWDEDEIKRYLKKRKFTDMNWREFSNEDLKLILDDFEKSKMIFFED